MTYQLGIDVDAVRAIDTHVHVEVDEDGHCALPQPVLEAATAYFKATPKRPGLDEIAEHYRSAILAAVVFTVDAGTNRIETQCNGDLRGAADALMAATYPAPGANPVLLAAGWDGQAGPRIARRLLSFRTDG